MLVSYQGRNTDITDTFRRHADPRIDGLTQYFERIAEVKIVVSQQRHLATVEITVDADGTLIRGEDRSPDTVSSFDKALDRVVRQLRDYKTKLYSRGRQERAAAGDASEPPSSENDETETPRSPDEVRIVRTKSHVLKPMTPQEAVLQMEMVGHDFFVFFDGQTERVGVVYRRHDGDYGLIEPEIG